MDFSAKRLTLLAGVGDVEDRHEIVREYAQQLNESSEARQMNENEKEVRKAVRRTIQKMISEGAINLQEDSIARELEHLRANIQADHDHVASLLDDIRDDRDEEHRAEEHRDEMREDEMHHLEEGDDETRDLEDKGEWEEDELEKGEQGDELDDPKLDDDKWDEDGDGELSAEEKAKRAEHEKKKDAAKKRVQAVLEPAMKAGLEGINENDASLMRLQKLAGIQILTEGKEEDELEEATVDGAPHGKWSSADIEAPPDWEQGDKRRIGIAEVDEEDEDEEAKLYELEDGRMYMEMGGKKFMMQEMEEELNELEEAEFEPVGQMDGKPVVKDEDGNLHTLAPPK